MTGEPVGLRAPGHPGALRDPRAIRRYRPLIDLYAGYWRPQVRGFEHVPARGPFLLVGNHSGGATPPDMPILLSAWWKQRSIDEPVYGLFHSTFLNLPGVRGPITRFGALEAGWDAAQAVLADGGIVMVYPGGDHEAFRPWRQRNRIDFAGRRGFLGLALRAGVPIVPVVTHGVQDGMLILSRGEKIAPFLPHLRAMRVKVNPVVIGLPWLVSFGLPVIPFPTRVTVQLCPPIDLDSEFGGDAAEDDEALTKAYERVTGAMQAVLDDLAHEARARRRMPLPTW